MNKPYTKEQLDEFESTAHFCFKIGNGDVDDNHLAVQDHLEILTGKEIVDQNGSDPEETIELEDGRISMEIIQYGLVFDGDDTEYNYRIKVVGSLTETPEDGVFLHILPDDFQIIEVTED